jgi:hypothetical protein
VSKSTNLDAQSTSKISTGFIVAGAIMMFLALCTLPAALDKNADSALVGIAASLFSFGALIIAGGFYLKAHVLKGQVADATMPESASLPRRGGCELCGNEAPVVKCKVHQLNLCGACLSRHYDYRSCSYVPASSGAPVKAPRAMAKSRGF